MYDNFPYSNFHDLNTDWIVKKIKDVETSEANAKASEENAKTSEIEAKTSELSAQANAHSAEQSADIARESASDAQGYAIEAGQTVANTLEQVGLLQSRVDNIIPSGTQTEGNTELLDIRVGYNGETYTSAGDAVRGQAGILNFNQYLENSGIINGLKNIGLGIQLVDSSKITTKKYYNSNGKSVNYTGEADLGTYPVIKNLPAGTYYINGELTAFTWIRNLTNQTIEAISNYISNTHDLIVPFDFDLMLTKQDNYNLIIGTNGYTTNTNVSIYNPNGYTFIDNTLTQTGKSADAYITGNLIHGIETNIISLLDNSYNILEFPSINFYQGKYWNSSLNKVTSETWGCYDPVTLGEGKYKISHYQNTFSFLKNVQTGTIENVNTHVTNGILTLESTYQVYISNNTTTAESELYNFKDRYVEVGEYSEFKTITDAINNTVDGDTIFVHSGVYEEQLQLWNKIRNIIGENRDSTIIIDHSGDYNTPPIEMSIGTLSNLTVIEDGANPAPDANMRAYCLHIEDTPDEANRSLKVNNCAFINYIHSPLGCGLYQDYSVEFTNCIFRCYATNEGTWERGAFYFHSNSGQNVSGQKITAENCIIESSANIAVYIGTPYTASGGECRYRFSNCAIWTYENGISNDSVHIQTDSDITITKMIDSYGNTIPKLNSTLPHTPEN